VVRRPTWTAPARVGSCNTAGRGEETGFQIEQRNRSRKQEREIAALKPLDNEKPIQAAVLALSTQCRVLTDSRRIAALDEFRVGAQCCRLGPSPKLLRCYSVSGEIVLPDEQINLRQKSPVTDHTAGAD
jgi:hypothetical protein